jgi:hypothetical protein
MSYGGQTVLYALYSIALITSNLCSEASNEFRMLSTLTSLYVVSIK